MPFNTNSIVDAILAKRKKELAPEETISLSEDDSPDYDLDLFDAPAPEPEKEVDMVEAIRRKMKANK